MNKQQKTYLLLSLVLLVWGVIGYQMYSRLNPKVAEVKVLELQSSFKKQPFVTEDFYVLDTVYRDPFLGKFPKKKRTVRKKVPKKEIPKIPFPRVVYNGMIQGRKNQLFILTINRKQEIVKSGQTIQEIKLVKGNEKEVILKFKKQTKTLEKQ